MPNPRSLLLISNSTCHGQGYLDHCQQEIICALQTRDVLFIPYARPDGTSLRSYTLKAREKFEKMGMKLTGINEYGPSPEDSIKAIQEAKTVFVGGGNTFNLLRTLRIQGLTRVMREKVMAGELTYIGASAGSNVAGLGIHTTNDMPVVDVSSFDGLGLVPFNINPHYIEKAEGSTHQGESRDTRIWEYLALNGKPAKVIALREGAMLRIFGDKMSLHGAEAFIFVPGDEIEKKKTKCTPGQSLDHLLAA